MDEEKEKIVYGLSKKMIIFLFIYYFILMLLGGGVVIVIMHIIECYDVYEYIIVLAFAISISVSCMLCSMRYVKKLYKACVGKQIQVKIDIIEGIGNMAYFLFRPLFACTFVILMIIALLSGMFAITGSLDYVLNEKFIYLCAVLSGFVGYSVGRTIDRFEHTSDKAVMSFK